MDVRRAANQADGEAIVALLEQIEDGHGNLAETLAALVHDFRFGDIMALMDTEKPSE